MNFFKFIISGISQITIFLLLHLPTFNYSIAQVSQQWAARYDGSAHLHDAGNSVITDASGNIFVTGTCVRTGNADCITIKYNSTGVAIWTSFYSHPDSIYDEGKDIAIDASGNVYVTGYSVSQSVHQYTTIKYSPTGTQQWVAAYFGPYNGVNDYDMATSIAVDASGSVYVTGHSRDSSGYSIATIKYNSSGIQQWVKREWSFGAPGANAGLDLDVSGNVYVAGSVMRGTTQDDYFIVKYNLSGTKQWERFYNGSSNVQDFAGAMTVDNSGNVYITGGSGNLSTGLDYATVKYNSSGTQQWVAIYNGTDSSTDRAAAINVDASGIVTVTGSSREVDASYNFTTAQYNSSGGLRWVRSYDGTDNDVDAGISVQSDQSGNIYVAGKTNGSDYATLKYNPAGTQQWLITYDGPDGGYSDLASKLCLDANGNVFVTGSSETETNGSDILTIRYTQSGSLFTLNLKAFIQGFYNPGSNNMTSDTARVYLRNASSPYSIIDSSKGILSSSGTGIFQFSAASNGVNYYLAVEHRNSIETWSSSAHSFSGGSMNYDFAIAMTQAYGNNMKLVDTSPLQFAFYNGDVNQDDLVELTDILTVFNATSVFLSGYVATDVTGDNFVDISDLTITYNNSSNFVGVIRP